MAANNARLYVVSEFDNGSGVKEEFLVEANSQSQAIRHIVGGRFVAVPAKNTDVARLMSAGQTVLKAKADDEQPAA